MFCSLITLLLFFPLQYTVNQLNHYRMSTVQRIVNNTVQKARTTGYFTDALIDEMVNNIKASFPQIEDSEIYVDVTRTPKYRLDTFDQREMIKFDVRVPIDKIIALPQLFYINEADNNFNYPVKGEAPSELPIP